MLEVELKSVMITSISILLYIVTSEKEICVEGKIKERDEVTGPREHRWFNRHWAPLDSLGGISAFSSVVRLTGDTWHVAYRRSPVSTRTCKLGFPVVARAIIVPQCLSLRRRICQEKANVNTRRKREKENEKDRAEFLSGLRYLDALHGYCWLHKSRVPVSRTRYHFAPPMLCAVAQVGVFI